MCPICLGTVVAFGAPGLVASILGHAILVKGITTDNEDFTTDINNPFL